MLNVLSYELSKMCFSSTFYTDYYPQMARYQNQNATIYNPSILEGNEATLSQRDIAWFMGNAGVISKNMNTFEFWTASGRSFMYMRNKWSPRHAPCSTHTHIYSLDWRVCTVKAWELLPVRKVGCEASLVLAAEYYSTLAFCKVCHGQLCGMPSSHR